MSRKDKPYLPLYVQDFITDEKLNECSAEAHGVYIRLMCLMHKSEQYGTILLKQKYKQNASKSEAKNKICLDFASQLAKQMPFPVEVIERGLIELVEEGVVYIENDCLVQKRMLNDGLLSSKRAEAGSKGGKSSRFALAKSQANVKQNSSKPLSKTLSKIEANPENEIEIENENNKGGVGEKENPTMEQGPLGSEVVQEAARKSYANAIWVENVCMANNLTKDDLKKWMAKYNSSICNDRIANFDDSTYRKLFTGWLSSQFSKGYSLPKESQPEKKETIKYLNS